MIQLRPQRRKAQFVTQPSSEPEWKAIHRVADRFSGATAREVRKAVEGLRRSVDSTEIRSAL